MKQDAKELSLEEAYSKAERYCARSEHCEADVRRKFYDWRVATEHQAEIIERLRSARYIDDERFALAFARDKHRFSGWGRERIRRELSMRHISGSAIERAFAEVFEELDEAEQLERLLRTKARQLKPQDPLRKRFEQLLRYGQYKGYSYDKVRPIAERLLRAEDPSGDDLDD